MFTVKQIDICGRETMQQVAATRFVPKGMGSNPNAVTSEDDPATLWIRETPDAEERPLTGGTIFVMNTNGKTVARYDLGASPVPQTVRLDRFGRVTPEAA